MDARTAAGTQEQQEEGAAEGYLPPLARRRLGSEVDLFADPDATPLSVVHEMLERGAHLVNTLVGDVASLQADREKERQRIEEEATMVEAAADAAAELLSHLESRAREVATAKAKVEDLDRPPPEPLDLPADADIDRILDRLEEEERLAKGITGAIRLPVIGALLRLGARRIEAMRAEAAAMRQRVLAETEAELNAEGKEALASYEIGLGVLARDLEALDAHLPLTALPWDDPRWAGWAPPRTPSRWLRLGSLHHEDLLGVRLPALVALPGERGLAIEAGARRDEAVDGVRSLLARIVAGFPAGGVHLSVVDPVGLGASAAAFLPLAEYDPALVTVAASTDEVEEHLTELTRHLETVIQQHLRGQYATLAELNDAAGEVVEPYRVVVAFDVPSQLDERAHKLLRGIVENGPRCGVFTVVVTAASIPQGQQAKVRTLLGLLDTITLGESGFELEVPQAGTWNLDLDPAPELALTGADGALTVVGGILTATGEQVRRGASEAPTPARVLAQLADVARRRVRDDVPDTATTAEPADPATWWTARAGRGIGLPLGRTPGREPACLWFDATHGTAVVVGPPDRGVGPLVDDAVLAAALLYPPEELELRRLDLAGGGAGTDDTLPHTSLLAAEAERELAVTVLAELLEEADRRGADLDDHAGDPPPAPRHLAVITGAERLLTTDDPVAARAAALLTDLGRRGGRAGVHVLLASDAPRSLGELTPEAVDALGAAATRVLVAAADPAVPVAWRGPGGDDVALRPGDAVLVGAPSAEGEPMVLTPLAFTAAERLALPLALRARAAAEQRGTTATVVGPAVPVGLDAAPLARLMSNPERQPERLLPRLWLGLPVVGADPVEVLLRRRDGSNLLVVTEDADLGQGMLVGALVSALLAQGRAVDVHVVDVAPRDEGVAELLAPLTGPFSVGIGRRDDLAATLAAVAGEVAARHEAADYRAAPVLLVLNGLGRARDLDARPDEQPLAGGGPAGAGVVGAGAAAEADPVALLSHILRDGPEVGVHTLAWCDSLAALRRRLPRPARRELTLRVTGPQSRTDSEALVESGAAALLRPDQAVLWDEEARRLTKLRPFRLPDPAFLEAMAAAAGGRR